MRVVVSAVGVTRGTLPPLRGGGGKVGSPPLHMVLARSARERGSTFVVALPARYGGRTSVTTA
jgi:hypothetical protein